MKDKYMSNLRQSEKEVKPKFGLQSKTQIYTSFTIGLNRIPTYTKVKKISMGSVYTRVK